MTAPEFLRARADAYRRHAPSMPPTIASDYQWIADELRRVADSEETVAAEAERLSACYRKRLHLRVCFQGSAPRKVVA